LQASSTGCALACLVCSCTFPDVTYDTTGAGAGGAGGTTTSTQAGGGGASNTGGATTTSNSGGAGTGGATTTTGAAGGVDCDVDGDMHDSLDCGGDDCDDTIMAVHPGTGFFTTPFSADPSDFDYDCSGIIETNVAIKCAKVGMSCPSQFADVGSTTLPEACGNSYPLKACSAVLGICTVGSSLGQDALVKCH
jgi:hypothetical protein